MPFEEELKEVYSLARRAFECQAELGYDEIFLEQGGQVSSNNDLSVAMTTPEVIVNPPEVEMEKPQVESTTTSFASLDEHNQAICNCTECPLGSTRTKFVYGVGNPHAKIMFVGEAPGKDEDEKGEPFVGRAGRLLDDIIKAMGLERSEVYIANILKCRPPQNRDPQPDEMHLCMPYLREQIRLIKPQFLCALGRIAAQGLLDTNTPLGKLRGSWHKFENIPLLVTYHPAALLRFQKYKRPTWEDMQFLMDEYARVNQDK